MKLPNFEKAEIDPAKIRDYLLSTVHPVGRFKAAFFRGLGYAEEAWEELRDDLLRVADFSEATIGEAAPSGRSTRSVLYWRGRQDAARSLGPSGSC